MPTLAALRVATTDRVAPHTPGTTGVKVTGGYAGVATGDSAARRVISTDLASVDVSGEGSENPTDYLKDEWLYLLTIPPQQRRIPEGGYAGYAAASEVATGYAPAPGTTAVGYVDLERPLAAVAPAGTAFEIHALPPLRAPKSVGVHAHVNRALRVMLREDTVLVPGVTGQHRYDVAATLPWLTNPALFVSAHFVETVAGLDSWAIPGATLRFDGNSVLLVPNSPFSTGQSVPVRVLRPLSTWIKANGAWGESTVGLVNEDDECLGDLDAISLVAAVHACAALADGAITESVEQVHWRRKAAEFASRSPFLKDQRTRAPRSAASWPDNISPLGRFAGRWGPGFR